MSQNPRELRLLFWQAVDTFGEKAVIAELRENRWAAEFPGLLQSIAGDDQMAHQATVLPATLILAIADRSDCVDLYIADPDGKRLFATNRMAFEASRPRSDETALVPTPVALRDYGAYCLFMASDKGTGYRDEQNPDLPADESS